MSLTRVGVTGLRLRTNLKNNFVTWGNQNHIRRHHRYGRHQQPGSLERGPNQSSGDSKYHFTLLRVYRFLLVRGILKVLFSKSDSMVFSRV